MGPPPKRNVVASNTNIDQLKYTINALNSGAHALGLSATQIIDTSIPIYCINMPHATRRAELVRQSAARHKLSVTFVPGIDARPTPNIDLHIAVPTPYQMTHQNSTNCSVTFNYAHNMKSVSYAELGCTLAHLLAMYTFLTTSDALYALITEDDVGFDLVPWWPVTLQGFVDNAPPDWEALHLQLTKLPRGPRYGVATQGKHNWNTVGYCVRRSAVECLFKQCLDTNNVFDMPCDPKIYPEDVIADVYIYRLFHTYHNFDFPAFTFVGDNNSSIRRPSVTPFEKNCRILNESFYFARLTFQEQLLGHICNHLRKQNKPGAMPRFTVVIENHVLKVKNSVTLEGMTLQTIQQTISAIAALPVTMRVLSGDKEARRVQHRGHQTERIERPPVERALRHERTASWRAGKAALPLIRVRMGRHAF
jgi:hypothetical protein